MTNASNHNGDFAPAAREALSRGKKYAGIAAVGTVAVVTAWSSIFTVDPTDVAFVRHYSGSVDKTPYRNNGIHIKLPYLDTVDRVQVSQRILNIPQFTVNTIDNQPITLGINLVVDTPVDSAYHLLYEVGKTGSGDIDQNIVPVVMDVAGRIASRQNTSVFSQNRETIQASITETLRTTLKDLYGMTLRRMQMPVVGFSDAFRTSNDIAVSAKNDALRAQYDAQRIVTQANADADKNVATARGEADSLVLRANANLKAAEANAQAAAKQGEGEKSRLTAVIAAFGSADKYNQYITASRWGGNVPTVAVNGAGNGVSVPVVLPVLPTPGSQSNAPVPMPQ